MIELLLSPAWLTPLATIVGSFITYFITKSNNSKDLTLTERKKVFENQTHVVEELKNMLTEQKEEIRALRDDVRQLQEENMQLVIENQELTHNVRLLNDRLTREDER